MFQSRTIAAMELKRQRRFGTQVQAATIAAAQIRELIEKIGRTVQSLNYDIEAEEERTGCRDSRDPAYSVLARNMAARRDNLAETDCCAAKTVGGCGSCGPRAHGAGDEAASACLKGKCRGLSDA